MNLSRTWFPMLLVSGLLGCSGHGHSHGEGGHDHGDEHAHGDHGDDHDDHGDDHDDHGEEEGDEHGHGGEDSVAITRWSEHLELFAEHPKAVVGEAMPFLAHVTILDGFPPVTEGSVTLVMEGPETLSARAEAPLRAGIFSPEIVPRTPGTYEARLEVVTPELSENIGGFQIVVRSAGAAEEPVAEEEEHSHTEPISFLKEQQWQIPFGTAFAEQRTLIETVDVAGEVTTPPDGRAAVGSPVAGRVVVPPGGFPHPGAEVVAGQLLATIAPSPASPETGARAGLAVAEAEAQLAAANADVERSERLIADEAISQRVLEDARREVRVAGEAVRAARQARSLFQRAVSGRGGGIYRLRAPISGIISFVDTAAGEAVSPEHVLFRIVDPSVVWIHVDVPELYAARVQADADASYRVVGEETWRPIHLGSEGTGSIVDIGRTVDEQSRTVAVHYALRDAPSELRVGGLVRVAVPIGEARPSVSVPRSAVVHTEGRTAVFVQVEGESFEERPVRIGATAGGYVALLSGVEVGERVVTRGANYIRLAAGAGAPVGHGHVH